MKTRFGVFAIAALFSTTLAFCDTIQFQVAGLDCAQCLPPVLKVLKGVRGVEKASLDFRSGRATVTTVGPVNRAAIREALLNSGFPIAFAGEKAATFQPLAKSERAKLDILTKSDGKKFEISKLLAPGKVTVVDFYGDWCAPCRILDMRLERYLVGHPGIAVRRVDIGRWDNGAATQATRQFRASALPYIRVYDRNGKFSSSVTGGMWDEVLIALEKASR